MDQQERTQPVPAMTTVNSSDPSPSLCRFGSREWLNRLVALSLPAKVDSQASDREALLLLLLPPPKSRDIPDLPCSVNGRGYVCSVLRHERPSWGQQEQDLFGAGGMFWEGTIAQM